MQTISRGWHSALMVCGGLMAVPVTAQDATAPGVPAPAVTIPGSRLTSAKTIKMNGTFSLVSPNGQAKPFFGVTVTVASLTRYRIDAAPLAGQAKQPSFYLTDGSKAYEYNSLLGKYSIADAPKAGERAKSQLYTMAGVALILTPDAPPRPNMTRTVREETLDGRKMVATTDLEPPRKMQDGGSYAAGVKTWRDASTGLPVRVCDISLRNGVTAPQLQMDFTGWTFDAPIPRQTFAWKVPPGAANTADDLLRIGSPAPDFSAVTANGTTVHLSDFKGKVVVLDFWATWCVPCQRSLPHLQKVYTEVKDKGVAVLGLCVWDERKEYDKWVAAKKSAYTFPTAFDPAGRADNNIAKKLYLVNSIPTQYVIDKDGKIAAAFVGYEEGSHSLEDALKKLHVDF